MDYFFDTHTHLTENDTDLQDYYLRACNAGVKYLLVCSSGWDNSMRSADFANINANVWFAAGVHPEDIGTQSLKAVSKYKDFASCTRFAAVGEIGLDYYYSGETRNIQIDFMKSFLDLAIELQRPAIIHCRDKNGSFQAYDDAFRLLQPFSRNGGKFVLHAFSGTPEYASAFLSLGSYFGVGGMITFRKAENIRETVSVIPPERILLETDSPYLAPVPFRGKVNHPSLLPFTADMLAKIKNKEVHEIRKTTTQNAFHLFSLEQERVCHE